ncbi:MAG: Bug family tripartite tricarboxylate transporter substrate binding protein [Lautropia sp.]
MSSVSCRFSKSLRCLAALAAIICAVPGAALAADGFPSGPIRLIVPFPPGGGGDISGRLFAQELEKRLKQSVIVDNRAGANGKIGVQAAMAAPKDGQTLLLATVSTHSTEPDLYGAKPPYDPVNDFAPVALINNMSMVLVVNPSVPVTTMAEFVALARKSPGSITYASAGLGNIGHLTMELFLREAGLKLTHVPYKGAADAVRDLLAGNVNTFFDVYPSELPHIKSGRVRPLAVSLTSRVPQTPEIPTTREAGFPNVVSSAWTGIVAPRGTPPEVVARLNAEANAILAGEAFQSGMRDRGFVAAEPNTPEQFKAFIEAETRKWSRLQRDIGLVK